MKPISRHDLLDDQIDQWIERAHAPTAPVSHGRVWNVSAHALEDLVQAV
jgi:hypothetical protein